ncbi:MAG: sulfite exporter TauE/SafE family protein [Alphaproteobacteria bacterium]|nr:sulfite exporter TauE/SafE family protein [Alphaproteobacteria bacterium]TAD87014.1 MAG: sulfite exporter TauE/SafE family protein [Alphaproteobacteria bacterium]
MITDPWFYAAAVPALLIFGISKGGFGAGLGMLAVPLMAQVVSPVQAAAIALPILCAMDLVGLRSFWRAVPWSLVMLVLVPAFAGILLGMITFQHLNLPVIEVLLGAIALLFTLWRLALAHWAVDRPPPGRWSGRLWGCVSGFTSFVAHAGGPPLAIWLLPQRLGKTSSQAINVVFFAVVNYAKLLPYAWLGQFDSQNLTTSLVLLPLAPIGVWIGVWCHARVCDTWFYRICYAALTLAGAKLLFDGLAGPGGLIAG